MAAVCSLSLFRSIFSMTRPVSSRLHESQGLAVRHGPEHEPARKHDHAHDGERPRAEEALIEKSHQDGVFHVLPRQGEEVEDPVIVLPGHQYLHHTPCKDERCGRHK